MDLQFPILDSTRRQLPTLPSSVPWAFVAPHEARALRNHDQTLKRLAERGGLGWSELANVIEDKAWDGRVFVNNPPEAVAYEANAAVRVLRALRTFEQGTKDGRARHAAASQGTTMTKVKTESFIGDDEIARLRQAEKDHPATAHTSAGGWCRHCGCGNDVLGYKHLRSCNRPQS